ncbi:MAG TPA: efflux RND transporter permease subunit [Steroidobacteraceae bacterium]|nr:efflux RND transporter permease subunit [Steroidobacteraceae bacterium]
MSISATFIRRPIATSLMATALLVLGVFAYFRLPVAALPQVDAPTIQVSAGLPGASPETMASNVATPLERQLSLIAGITQMTSNSNLGSTSITLQFELDRDIDAAAQDVQAAISAAAGQLPNNMPSPPVMRKVNPADSSVLVIAMTSDTMPMNIVSDYADSVVGQRLSRMKGVGQVNYGGARKPAIRIRVDPRKAAALGLQLEQIRTAIVQGTANAPKGQLIGQQQTLIVYTNDQMLDAQSWNNLIVGYRNGAPIRVSDLGGAILSVENTQGGAYSEVGKAGRYETLKSGPAIHVIVFRQPGANVIETVDAVKAALPELRAAVPPGINMEVIADRTLTIRASVYEVKLTLLITIVLVVGVIFLFLRNVMATAIPSAVIPVSLLATAAVMLPAGFTLDNLSLMALTIAVGFVVDDAIVMVEVIWRRIERGQSPFEAALAGSREIGSTIFTISVSLIAVFTPVMFMGGVVGIMMREFALTLSAAVLVSVVLSLTLTPMLCARFLRAPRPATSAFISALESGFQWVESHYERSLARVLRHKAATLAVFVATLALTALLYATAQTGFFPQQDTGFLQGTVVAPQGSPFAYTERKSIEAMKIIAEDPDIDEAHYNAGGAATSQLNIALRSLENGRTASATDIINRLRPKLAGISGAQVILQAMQDITIGGRSGRAQYQYTLSDGDLDELNAWTPRLVAEMQKAPELKDVSSDQQSQAPAANVIIDRDAAGRFGISPTDIDAAIYNQVGQRQVAQYFTQVNNYRVIMEAPPELQLGPALFDAVYLVSPRTGRPVPLSSLVKVDTTRRRSLSIAHQGQFPATTISFNLAPGASLGAATAAVERARGALGAPSSLQGSFQGNAQAFQQSLQDMPLLIMAALLSVYVILGVLYESYFHPLTILSTLPSAGLGALLALRLAGHDLDVIGIIAIILLIGIVKKNGIMIVDVALTLEREEKLDPEEAVRRASHQRLRPILMTTAAAFLGGVPMILGHGTGSEFRQPLGWAIVGGLAVSQVMTLFTTPVIYIYLDRIRRRFERDERESPSESVAT